MREEEEELEEKERVNEEKEKEEEERKTYREGVRERERGNEKLTFSVIWKSADIIFERVHVT